jgi:hypothetical protein
MPSRLVVIILCVSLVGVTVVPASSIPCCCKSMHATRADRNGISGDRAEMGPACCTAGAVKARSCCAGKLVSSCSKRIVRAECPRCRCLEQMQIVALSGYTAFENTVRVPPVTFVALVELSSLGPSNIVGLVPETDCRDVLINLRTCTLRC